MFISMPLAALCIVAGFRILRQWMAVILTPIAYTLLVAGTVALRNGTLKMTNEAWSLAATLACYRYCFYFFFLLGVILALRWIKSPWVALALGSWPPHCPRWWSCLLGLGCEGGLLPHPELRYQPA